MPRQQTEDDKKHGDKLEPLIERAGKESADDEPEELEGDEDEDLDEDDDEDDDVEESDDEDDTQ
jgi:hypothetical protein